MKPDIANSKRLYILGNADSSSADCSSAPEVLTALLKKWGRKLGCCSVFAAAVPAILATQISEAESKEVNRPQANVSGRGARFFESLKPSCSNRALLKLQSEFRPPHQMSSFAMLTALAGNDNCPGRAIPGGSYTAASPYIDTGDTTGANSTVNSLPYYYTYDAHGPDHVYSFTLTGRGSNPLIEISTTSGTYRPLIYILGDGPAGGCPAGTGNSPNNILVMNDSRWTVGSNTARLGNSQMNFLPLNVPLYLFVDSALNDASGAGPYSIRIEDVTIAPVPACAITNRIDCPDVFVRQQYLDFLGREPDPPGFAAWLALQNNCLPGDTSCDRIHVSGAFFQSPEFQGRGYFLYRFYPVAFGRKPDYLEFLQDRWRVSGFLSDAQLEGGKVGFITDFMNRSAFGAKFNGLDNTQYVDTLLSTAGITHSARDFWIAALGSGTRTRAQVLREIAESTEVYNKYYNQAFVVMQYFGYLRRQPDALYLNWIAHLDATGDSRSMIDGFINSLEYRARFAP